MRKFLLSAAIAAAVIIPAQASADTVSDRTAAIQLCRTQIAAQAGVEADQVRLDQVRVRGRTIQVDLDLWSDAGLTNVRCNVARGGDELTVAAIDPAIATASATSTNAAAN